MILDRKSHLALLLVRHTHEVNHHSGPTSLVALLGTEFLIVGIARLAKQISRACIVCRKLYGHPSQQLMAPLPADRVNPAPPFFITGIDFAGPFPARVGKVRNPTRLKVYVCVFVCFVTKAVHLELVMDLTTAAFLAALKRFAARRGQPRTIYSDNGTNFVGACSN